jgi:hypothetical protein
MLFENGQDPRPQPNEGKGNSEAYMSTAAYSGNTALLRRLIDCEFEGNITWKDPRPDILCYAVSASDHKAAVQSAGLLLGKEYSSACFTSALVQVIRDAHKGHEDGASALPERGAHPCKNIKSHQSPLTAVAEREFPSLKLTRPLLQTIDARAIPLEEFGPELQLTIHRAEWRQKEDPAF